MVILVRVWLSYQINELSRTEALVIYPWSALSYEGQYALPVLGLALLGGLFGAFGLVEDLVYFRYPYALARTMSARAYVVLRTLGPALGAAWATMLGCVSAAVFGRLRYPRPMVTQTFGHQIPARTDSWLVHDSPLVNDLLFIVFSGGIAATFALLAGAVAWIRRQLLTLLFPAAVTIAVVLIPGPLGHVGQNLPESLGEVPLAVAFWMLVGVCSMAVVLCSLRWGRERLND